MSKAFAVEDAEDVLPLVDWFGDDETVELVGVDGAFVQAGRHRVVTAVVGVGWNAHGRC